MFFVVSSLWWPLVLAAQVQVHIVKVGYKFSGPKPLELQMTTCLKRSLTSFKEIHVVQADVADYVLDAEGSVNKKEIAVAFRVLLTPSKNWSETHFDPRFYDQAISKEGDALVLNKYVIRDKTIQSVCETVATLVWSNALTAERNLAK